MFLRENDSVGPVLHSEKIFLSVKTVWYRVQESCQNIEVRCFQSNKFPVAVIPFEKTAFLETWLIWSTTST